MSTPISIPTQSSRDTPQQTQRNNNSSNSNSNSSRAQSSHQTAVSPHMYGPSSSPSSLDSNYFPGPFGAAMQLLSGPSQEYSTGSGIPRNRSSSTSSSPLQPNTSLLPFTSQSPVPDYFALALAITSQQRTPHTAARPHSPTDMIGIGVGLDGYGSSTGPRATSALVKMSPPAHMVRTGHPIN